MKRKVTIRKCKIDGVDYEFHWLDGDEGTWSGPLDNWMKDHKRNIEEQCKQKRTVIQAGGASGMYPVFLSQMFDQVYTFEPTPESFHCLFLNTQTFKNIHKMHCALGCEHRMISMSCHETNMGENQVQLTTNDRIPMLCLDDFEFENLDLIMLDVEGYEHNIIAGGYSTISRHLPVIFAENGVKEAWPFLLSLGYREWKKSSADMIYLPPEPPKKKEEVKMEKLPRSKKHTNVDELVEKVEPTPVIIEQPETNDEFVSQITPDMHDHKFIEHDGDTWSFGTKHGDNHQILINGSHANMGYAHRIVKTEKGIHVENSAGEKYHWVNNEWRLHKKI